MFAIQMPDGRYVLKEGGWNHFVTDKQDATRYPTKEAALDARPGHHKDMGGAGYVGRVVRAP
jgi:hypothetical protein